VAETQTNGLEVLETREWLDSLDYVLAEGGPERAGRLLQQLSLHAKRAAGVNLPFTATTPYQNTIAAVRLVHAFTPAMKERGWGRLIQVSSRTAISPHANLPTYGAAKAALNNVTLSLSKELAGTGVTSNGIMPGLIYTPQLNKWFIETAQRQGSDDPEFGKQYALKNIIHQTVGRLDIAAAVCFLASPLIHDRHDFPHRWRLDTYRVER